MNAISFLGYDGNRQRRRHAEGTCLAEPSARGSKKTKEPRPESAAGSLNITDIMPSSPTFGSFEG